MDDNYAKIKDSIQRVGRRATLVRLGEGVALLGAIALVLFSVGLVSAAQLSVVPYARMGYFVLSTIIIIYVSYRYILTPIQSLGSQDRLALFMEKRFPRLKDLLISSIQLGRDLENPGRARLFSHELAGLLFKQTGEGLVGLRAGDVVESRCLMRNLTILGLLIGLFAVITAMNPTYVAQRFNLLLEPRYVPSVLLRATAPVIGDITLTYRYPAYTGLKPRTITGSSGDIRILKGSEVEIVARSNQPVDSASILINESTRVPMTVETPHTIKGSLIVLEDGNYSFETLPAGRRSAHKSKSHRIIALADDYPRITILSPAQGKVVGERDVIDLEYEAMDDFGLKEIRLVVGEGPGAEGARRDLKVIKEPKTRFRDSCKWDLSMYSFTPGKKVPYFLEAVDNDAVSEPKVARSETRYIEVYSTQKKHEELISLQDKLLKEMTLLLADKLVNRPDAMTARDELLMQQEVLSGRTINLLVLFEKILTDMEEDTMANYAVYYSLENMRNTIAQLNAAKDKLLEKIERRGPVLSTVSISGTQSMQDDDVVELEDDVMYLME
ncbi:MAG: hypothetical protein J3T61_10905, partial [Candidatus Brocadiales bacterium]|nr:hypothetical protein [Candidatus Bathyanammoxibius sp.]